MSVLDVQSAYFKLFLYFSVSASVFVFVYVYMSVCFILSDWEVYEGNNHLCSPLDAPTTAQHKTLILVLSACKRCHPDIYI